MQDPNNVLIILNKNADGGFDDVFWVGLLSLKSFVLFCFKHKNVAIFSIFVILPPKTTPHTPKNCTVLIPKSCKEDI